MTQLSGPRVTDFDRTTAVIPADDRAGELLVDLDAGWSALVGVHGGSMCALAVRGAEALAPDRTVGPLEARPIDAARLITAADRVHRSGFALAGDAWLTGWFGIEDSTGGLAVERGRIAQVDGTVVAESFQTRLTAQS